MTGTHRATGVLGIRGIDMILSDEKRKEFEEISRPVIKFLNDNCHPHVTVIIDNSSAELSEGVCAFGTEDYWLD